jgi:ABC-type transport system substrate-binding protein
MQKPYIFIQIEMKDRKVVPVKHVYVILICCLFGSLIEGMTLLPTYGWIYPEDTQDQRFEMFGPRADRLVISLYSSEYSEFSSFEDGDLDLVNSALTRAWVDKWATQSPYKENIKIVSRNSTSRMFGITINTNNNEYLVDQNPDYPNQAYPNPCSVSGFRHALAHLIDRSYIIGTYWDGYASPTYTLVPSSMPDYVAPRYCSWGNFGKSMPSI